MTEMGRRNETLRRRILALKHQPPWPEFGYPSDPREAARQGFNAACDQIADLVATGRADPSRSR